MCLGAQNNRIYYLYELNAIKCLKMKIRKISSANKKLKRKHNEANGNENKSIKFKCKHFGPVKSRFGERKKTWVRKEENEAEKKGNNNAQKTLLLCAYVI